MTLRSRIRGTVMRLFLALMLLVASPVALVSLQAQPAHATSSLNVYVGYSGGPYYLKASYTADQLEALADNRLYAYTGLDKGGFLNKFIAWGIPLDKLFQYTASQDSTGNNQGVNTAALWRIFFATVSEEDRYNQLGFDGYGKEAWYWGSYGLYDATHTLDVGKTPRYYYNGFPNHFNFNSNSIAFDENGSHESLISQTGVVMPSMIALRYQKSRIYSVAQWAQMDEDYQTKDSLMDANNRLVFGQLSPSDVGVGDSVYDVAGVYCVYSGRPEVSLLDSGGNPIDQITGKIGQTIRVRANIKSADPLISQQGVKDLKWSSANPSVARVTSNGNGTADVTIVGKGDVQIDVSFGDSAYGEFVTSASANVSGPGGSGWRGEGEGAGWEYGDGDGERGPGAGSQNGPGDQQGDGTTGNASDGTNGDASVNTNIGNDSKDVNANDSVFGIGSSEKLEKLPNNAVQMVMAASDMQQRASSTASEMGAGGTDSSSTINEENAAGEASEDVEALEELLEQIPEPEWSTAYKINLDEEEDTPLAQTSPDVVQIPWGVIGALVLAMLIGSLGQLIAFNCSLDRKAGAAARV